jgi:hypothetical protein
MGLDWFVIEVSSCLRTILQEKSTMHRFKRWFVIEVSSCLRTVLQERSTMHRFKRWFVIEVSSCPRTILQERSTMHRLKRNFDRTQRLWRRESSVGVLNNNNHNNKNSNSAFVVARGDPHFSCSTRLCITEPRHPLLVYWIAAVDCSFLLCAKACAPLIAELWHTQPPMQFRSAAPEAQVLHPLLLHLPPRKIHSTISTIAKECRWFLAKMGSRSLSRTRCRGPAAQPLANL